MSKKGCCDLVPPAACCWPVIRQEKQNRFECNPLKSNPPILMSQKVRAREHPQGAPSSEAKIH